MCHYDMHENRIWAYMSHKLSTSLSLSNPWIGILPRPIFCVQCIPYQREMEFRIFGSDFTQINGINLIQRFGLRFHSIPFRNAIFMIPFRFYSCTSIFRCHQYEQAMRIVCTQNANKCGRTMLRFSTMPFRKSRYMSIFWIFHAI